MTCIILFRPVSSCQWDYWDQFVLPAAVSHHPAERPARGRHLPVFINYANECAISLLSGFVLTIVFHTCYSCCWGSTFWSVFGSFLLATERPPDLRHGLHWCSKGVGRRKSLHFSLLSATNLLYSQGLHDVISAILQVLSENPDVTGVWLHPKQDCSLSALCRSGGTVKRKTWISKQNEHLEQFHYHRVKMWNINLVAQFSFVKGHFTIQFLEIKTKILN